MTETFIFKDKIIRNNDVELTFHKDIFWNFNNEPFPVMKYTLTNCRNVETINFDSIDYYHDGVIIDIKQENELSVFETTDMGGVKIKIYCDKVEEVELEFNRQDFEDLIKEISKQRDNEYNSVTLLTKRLDNLKQFLNHELDIVSRKIIQADWLTENKKYFLQGQQEMIKKTLEKIDKI